MTLLVLLSDRTSGAALPALPELRSDLKVLPLAVPELEHVRELEPAAVLVDAGENAGQAWSVLTALRAMEPRIATLVIVVVPYILRMMRAAMVEVLESDYVEMARLKGVPEFDLAVLRLSGERAALPGATLAIGMPAEGDHLIAMGASGRRGRSAGAGRLRRLPGFSDNDPMVSPWKAWSQKTSFERPVAARASLIAASTASVPELQKKTRSCCGIRRIRCSARTEASSCTRSGRSRLSISVTAFLIAGWFRPSA